MNRQVRLSLVLLVIHKHLHRVYQQVFFFLAKASRNQRITRPGKRRLFHIAIGSERRDNLLESRMWICYWLSNIHFLLPKLPRILTFDLVSRFLFRAMPFEHLHPGDDRNPSRNPVNAAHSL